MVESSEVTRQSARRAEFEATLDVICLIQRNEPFPPGFVIRMRLPIALICSYMDYYPKVASVMQRCCKWTRSHYVNETAFHGFAVSYPDAREVLATMTGPTFRTNFSDNLVLNQRYWKFLIETFYDGRPLQTQRFQSGIDCVKVLIKEQPLIYMEVLV